MAVYCTVTPPARIIGPIRHAAATALRVGAYEIAADWRKNIPHDWPGQSGVPTGNSARSITVHQPSQTRVTIGSSRVSVKSLEEGARAHTIRPRSPGKTLRWPAERGGYGPAGAWRVRRFARHPGVRARRIGQWALTFNRTKLLHRIVVAIRDLSI